MSAFDDLAAKLAQRGGVTNPKALAASIGRKKYGAQAMGRAAAKGESAQTAQREVGQGAAGA